MRTFKAIRRYFWTRCAVLLLSANGTAAAQADPPSCATAAAQIRQGALDRTIIKCPASGPVVLAQRWANPTDLNADELFRLAEISKSLLDDRLYSAVAATARDENRAAVARLAALSTLASYVGPYHEANYEYLTKAVVGQPIPFVAHRTSTRGATPLLTSSTADIAALLADLAARDRDPVVKGAALRLRAVIAATHPEHTPVASGAVQLIAGCGTSVTLRSLSDVALPVQVRVLGTNFDKPFTVRRTVDGKPVDVLLGLPAGVVVATYGGREVARLTQRNAPCKPWETRQ